MWIAWVLILFFLNIFILQKSQFSKQLNVLLKRMLILEHFSEQFFKPSNFIQFSKYHPHICSVSGTVQGAV